MSAQKIPKHIYVGNIILHSPVKSIAELNVDFLSCELVGEETRTKRSRKKRPFSVSELSQLSHLPTFLS